MEKRLNFQLERELEFNEEEETKVFRNLKKELRLMEDLIDFCTVNYSHISYEFNEMESFPGAPFKYGLLTLEFDYEFLPDGKTPDEIQDEYYNSLRELERSNKLKLFKDIYTDYFKGSNVIKNNIRNL